MSRITKKIAKDLASQLLQRNMYAFGKSEQSFQSHALNLVLEKMPKHVRKTMNDSAEFLTYSTIVIFECSESFRSEIRVVLAAPVPVSSKPVPLTMDEYKTLYSMQYDLGRRQDKFDKLVSDTTEVMYRLRTKSKILTEFPSLKNFIPETKPREVPSLESVKSRLQ